MKYIFLLFPLIISAQLTNISGFVKSESGNLGYASISLLNSQNGVIANDDGYFEIDIDLSKHNDLLISYIGHVSKKISLKNNTLNFNNIIIYLDEDINGLNEIVVTSSISISGREAYYEKYGRTATKCVLLLGGDVTYSGRVLGETLIEYNVPLDTMGNWEAVGIIEYPKAVKMLDLEKMPGYSKALEHRDAGLEKTYNLYATKN